MRAASRQGAKSALQAPSSPSSPQSSISPSTRFQLPRVPARRKFDAAPQRRASVASQATSDESKFEFRQKLKGEARTIHFYFIVRRFFFFFFLNPSFSLCPRPPLIRSSSSSNNKNKNKNNNNNNNNSAAHAEVPPALLLRRLCGTRVGGDAPGAAPGRPCRGGNSNSSRGRSRSSSYLILLLLVDLLFPLRPRPQGAPLARGLRRDVEGAHQVSAGRDRGRPERRRRVQGEDVFFFFFFFFFRASFFVLLLSLSFPRFPFPAPSHLRPSFVSKKHT